MTNRTVDLIFNWMFIYILVMLGGYMIFLAFVTTWVFILALPPVGCVIAIIYLTRDEKR